MKYIMEIEEKPLCVFDKDTQTYFPRLWRVKGFNSLVFDEEGLSRLEELNSDYINEHYGSLQEDAYRKDYADGREVGIKDGMCEAWEAARKIIHMPEGELLNIFTECYSAVCTVLQVILKYDASEAIEKLKAYDEKQKAEDEIKVGDEVRRKSAPENERGGIVTKDWENSYFIMWTDGSSGRWDKDKVVKTGRHFDIASILKEMQS